MGLTFFTSQMSSANNDVLLMLLENKNNEKVSACLIFHIHVRLRQCKMFEIGQ